MIDNLYSFRGGGGSKYEELTQADYDALPSSKESDGVIYYITDTHKTMLNGVPYLGTDANVTQTVSDNQDSNYYVLFSDSTTNSTQTEGARKSDSIKINPKYGTLRLTKSNSHDVTYLNPGFMQITNTSNISAQYTNTDIELSGTDNTWDGTHTSLKDALAPISGKSSILGGTTAPASSLGSNGDAYIKYIEFDNQPYQIDEIYYKTGGQWVPSDTLSPKTMNYYHYEVLPDSEKKDGSLYFISPQYSNPDDIGLLPNKSFSYDQNDLVTIVSHFDFDMPKLGYNKILNGEDSSFQYGIHFIDFQGNDRTYDELANGYSGGFDTQMQTEYACERFGGDDTSKQYKVPTTWTYDDKEFNLADYSYFYVFGETGNYANVRIYVTNNEYITQYPAGTWINIPPVVDGFIFDYDGLVSRIPIRITRPYQEGSVWNLTDNYYYNIIATNGDYLGVGQHLNPDGSGWSPVIDSQPTKHLNYMLDDYRASANNATNNIYYMGNLYTARYKSGKKGTEVEANPSDTATDTLTKVRIDDVVYSISGGGGGTTVVANPSGTATVDLTKLQVDNTIYGIETGNTVVANPSGSGTADLTKIQVDNTVYDIPSGTTVVANPSGTPTDSLSTIQIGSTVYDIPSGSGRTYADIFDGASSVTLTSPNGVTVVSSSVSDNKGSASLQEGSAGYEGFNIALQNLTVGKEYTLSFDIQCTTAQWFTGQYMFGYLVTDSAKTNYTDYTQWTENLDRDLLKHNHEYTFTATATTHYLSFNVCGFSDLVSNYFDITDLCVYEVSGSGGSWTDVTGTLTAGNTTITLSNASITTTSTLDFYTDTYSVNPTAVSVSTGSVTLTFEAQASDLGVKVRVS